MDPLRQMSLLGLLSIVLAFPPLVMAVMYVIRPNERRLALMRPLSLAGLFAALTGTVLGFINTFAILWKRDFNVETYQVVAVGAGEALVSLLVGFACLTVSWLLVAAGMGRQRD